MTMHFWTFNTKDDNVTRQTIVITRLKVQQRERAKQSDHNTKDDNVTRQMIVEILENHFSPQVSLSDWEFLRGKRPAY